MLLPKMVRIALGTVTIAGLAACGGKGSPSGSENRVSLSEILGDSHATPAEKAEDLSLAAEKLINRSSFAQAHAVAKLALKVDAQNPRARLIAALLAPSIELKGAARRIAPLARNTHPGEYKKLLANVQKEDRAFQKFAMSGPEDIETEAQAQELIARVIVRLDELRRTLNSLKSEEFDITFDKNSLSGSETCSVLMPAPGDYDLSTCPRSSVQTRKVNRADFEIMSQMVAGYQVYLTILNGYNLDGAAKVRAAVQSGQISNQRRDVYRALMANKSFGQLRKNTVYGVIPDVAKDAVLGARYALENQKTLCPTGSMNGTNRPGYALEHGVCIDTSDSTSKIISLIEAAAKGQIIEIEIDGNEKVAARPLQFFASPVQDLRSETVTFNSCGQVTSIGDGKWGGMFPAGELQQVLAKQAPCH